MRCSVTLNTGVMLMFVLAISCSAPKPPANSVLAPCPKSPNCVSTEATDAHHIEPFRYSSSRDEAKQRLLEILRSMPRTTIVSSAGEIIRAEFRTRIFRFVDDGVFAIDDATKTVRFRSASRVGHSDLGVNRRRMEVIRTRFEPR